MKKVISILLSTLLLLSMCCPAHAYDVQSSTSTVKVINTNGYSFSITERETKNHQVIRTYQRNVSEDSISSAASDSTQPIEKISTILVALGMDPEIVDQLDNETLSEYAIGAEITSTTSYIKSDENGNQAYVSEEEALCAVAALEQTASSSDMEKYEDSYMKLVHMAINYGKGLYLFSASATWLNMPVFRFNDSIGSCAPTISIQNETRSGWYSYSERVYRNSTSEDTTRTVKNDITNIGNKADGQTGWYGSAGIFRLPSDYTDPYSSITCTNLKSYYEFKAYLRYPGLETYFNSIGSYVHRRITLNVDPSLSFTYGSKDITASIGISVGSYEDLRAAETSLHYTP